MDSLCGIVKKGSTLKPSRGHKIKEEVATDWGGSVWGKNAPLTVTSSRKLPLDEELQRDLLD